MRLKEAITYLTQDNMAVTRRRMKGKNTIRMQFALYFENSI